MKPLVTSIWIWKRNLYHVAVQRITNSSHFPTPQSYVGAFCKVRMVLGYKGMCAEKSNNYCCLLFLSLYLFYIIKHCFILLIFIVCAYIYFSFVKIGRWDWSLNSHCRSKNSPNEVSIQLCEQHTVAVGSTFTFIFPFSSQFT